MESITAVEHSDHLFSENDLTELSCTSNSLVTFWTPNLLFFILSDFFSPHTHVSYII